VSDYLAAAGRGAPAVVVVHDWYGQLPHVRGLADDLAGAGVTALAVDLYDGASTTAEAEAQRLMDALDGTKARQRLIDAVKTLRSADHAAPRVSAVAFSMGGDLALSAAKAGLFDAVVGYYATALPDDAPLPCPVQLHLAETDDFEPPDLPQQFVAAVVRAGGTAEFHVYEGTQHSFANADAAYYDEAATAQAWYRTRGFLGV
jgi:carboxymethylenebutenolidase